ncbi:hypothetical protein [Streptomyces smyrnaeus]|uniref:hypothetical protein n=1 Tax=Streptomyces smyrnaeus TaxID=1387713 RepID=UPI0033D72EE7
MGACSYVTVPRPTEHAALRRLERSEKPRPAVPALMAALLDANDRKDRAGVCLCAHAAVRSALGGAVGE